MRLPFIFIAVVHGSYLLCVVLLVHSCHKLLEFCCIFIADGWLIVVIVILEYLWEHIGNCLSLRVTHHMDGGIYRLSQQLIGQKIALAVAHDDEMNLPQPQIIQKLVAVVAYLAHD